MHWKSYVVGSVGDVKTDIKNSLNNLWVTLINYEAQLTQEQYLGLYVCCYISYDFQSEKFEYS